MVDYEWYRSFLAIYQAGTVTRAAEDQGLTQPAVTQHLAALEAVAGQALFTRTARRMLPTERGKALYSQVISALEALDRASIQLRHNATTTLPEVRLGTPREYFSAIALSRIAAAPLRVWTQFGPASGLLKALRDGELDFAIATERLNIRELEYRKLAEERFVLVAGAGSDPPIRQPASPEERRELEGWASGQPWVSYARDLPIIRRFWRQCFGTRPEIEPRLIIPDLLVLAQAVAAGSGISVLPSYLCESLCAAGSIITVWSPEPAVTNDLWMAWRVADRQRPAVELAREALASGWPARGDGLAAG